MKKSKKTELFNSPAKRFIWVFLAINLLGFGTNAVLYFLKLPNRVETILNSDAFFIALAAICYIAFNAMLYLIIKMHFLLSTRKE
ncbi:hypothetical protein [uncultured Campylobacter sp.]|uniref:hypothetical protein n=1 Tax=uncultured Campylobacter sp. TaxID=218934 RepID=UPI002628C5D5|nr:hypothetical protein [uncultured Campylobacter sp.]